MKANQRHTHPLLLWSLSFCFCSGADVAASECGLGFWKSACGQGGWSWGYATLMISPPCHQVTSKYSNTVGQDFNYMTSERPTDIRNSNWGLTRERATGTEEKPRGDGGRRPPAQGRTPGATRGWKRRGGPSPGASGGTSALGRLDLRTGLDLKTRSLQMRSKGF